MTRTEHLLWILAEECAEVAQRVSKAARFGLSEVEPGQSLTNEERIGLELSDVFASVEMLVEDGAFTQQPNFEHIAAKKAKVEKYLNYSRACGTLVD